MNPFLDEVPLQLRHGAKNREDHLPHGRRCVDALRERHEINAKVTELLEGSEQVRHRAGKAIEPGHNHDIKLPCSRRQAAKPNATRQQFLNWNWENPVCIVRQYSASKERKDGDLAKLVLTDLDGSLP